MKKLLIQEKLKNIDVSVEDLILGDYDVVSRFTAEKQRNQNDPLYKKVGCFYTPNRERAILICSLMKQYGLKSFLEIGFGRGYTTLCVAKMMTELNIDGKISTIDPNFDQQHIELLTKIFPQQWFDKITFHQGMSKDILPGMLETFDLIYVDGGHLLDEVKSDWELCKDKFNSILVFDDYCLPSKNDPGLQIAPVVDTINEEEIDCLEKELVITDRRLYVDDRGYTNDQIDYGQICLTKKAATLISNLW